MNVSIEVTEIIAESSISETVITCDVVISIDSDVNKAYVDAELYFKVDKVDNHSLVPDSEIEKLAEYPELPEVPEGYYLADDGTFKALPDFVTEQEMEDYVDSRASGGGGALSLYLSAENSTVAGFKKLKDSPDVALQEVAHNVAVGETLMHEFLYTAPIATTIIDAGTHFFNLIAKINITAGNSSIIFRPFLRHLNGSKTTLFSVSKAIASTAFTQIQVEFPSVAIHCLATDTYGIGIYFSTTVNAKIVTTQIGDGAASYIVVPLALRHKNTRNKNEEADFQHVNTTTTKNTLVEADKVAILDSVTNELVLTPKSNFGSQLLVDYTHTANKEVNVESIDFITSVITATNHGLANNTQLFIANKLAANVLYPMTIIPTGLNTGNPYFVINKTDNTFQVSLTSGGAAVAITNKATKDYTKWHFETKATVNITNLANLKKCLIKTFGKCFDNSANYLLFKKNANYILGSINTVWFANAGRYNASVIARLLTDITTISDLFSDFSLQIDFSLPRAKILVNGARMRSLTDTTNSQTTVSNAFWIHTTDGDIDFDEVQIEGVFNGFNIKIYSA